jgi:ABC-type lipoprotein release transport system permease subunit
MAPGRDRLKLMFVRNQDDGAAAGLPPRCSQLMSALLFEINPIDPLTYGVVVVALLTAAAVASYVPARRVTRIDPVEALRAE